MKNISAILIFTVAILIIFTTAAQSKNPKKSAITSKLQPKINKKQSVAQTGCPPKLNYKAVYHGVNWSYADPDLSQMPKNERDRSLAALDPNNGYANDVAYPRCVYLSGNSVHLRYDPTLVHCQMGSSTHHEVHFLKQKICGDTAFFIHLIVNPGGPGCDIDSLLVDCRASTGRLSSAAPSPRWAYSDRRDMCPDSFFGLAIQIFGINCIKSILFMSKSPAIGRFNVAEVEAAVCRNRYFELELDMDSPSDQVKSGGSADVIVDSEFQLRCKIKGQPHANTELVIEHPGSILEGSNAVVFEDDTTKCTNPTQMRRNKKFDASRLWKKVKVVHLTAEWQGAYRCSAKKPNNEWSRVVFTVNAVHDPNDLAKYGTPCESPATLECHSGRCYISPVPDVGKYCVCDIGFDGKQCKIKTVAVEIGGGTTTTTTQANL